VHADHDVLLPLWPAGHDDRRLRERVAAVHLSAVSVLTSAPDTRCAALIPYPADSVLSAMSMARSRLAKGSSCKQGSLIIDAGRLTLAQAPRFQLQLVYDTYKTSGADATRRKRTECLYALTRNRPYLVGKLVSATNVVCDSSSAALPSANAASGSSWATSVGPFSCWYRSRSASLDIPIGFGRRWRAQPVMRGGPSRLTTLQPLLPLSGAVQDVLQSRLDCALLAASAGLLHVILVSGLLMDANIGIALCTSCWSMSD